MSEREGESRVGEPHEGLHLRHSLTACNNGAVGASNARLFEDGPCFHLGLAGRGKAEEAIPKGRDGPIGTATAIGNECVASCTCR